MNKTKVIATIGPATNSLEMLEKLIVNGVDVIRVNTSHASIDFCKDVIAKINELNDRLKRNIAVMLDIKGPIIRIGKFQKGSAFYNKGEKIRIYMSPVLGDYTKFSIDYNISEYININQLIKADDGKIEFKVIDKDDNSLLCQVVKEGTLTDYKSINIPNMKLNRPYLNDRDKQYIEFAIKNEVDFLALSFVRGAEDVLDVSDLLIEYDNDHIGVISKIENSSAVDEIDKIIKVSDGVMIARGDLGVELPIEKIPGIQKKIISKCHKEGIVSIVATELLSNMTDTIYPTRAEVSDVANAVLDGTDAVMLSGETTIGRYPIEALKMMEKVIKSAEYDIDYERLSEVASKTEEMSTTGSIAYSVATSANNLKCKAIFAPTVTGNTARKISRFRPSCPIVAVSPNVSTVKALALNFGVCPLLISELKTIDSIIEKSKKFAVSALNLQENDKIIITGGYPFKKVKYTNFMQIEEI